KVEDVAYSLLGIFGVGLEVVCGPRTDRSFCRLGYHAVGDPSGLNSNTSQFARYS
ncbi:uncharacterized protein EDB93DRAFT_1090886, partial [Suillus bovinus]|uniref:uncharacterized protein n=1 Tax=Suillus bovinus TaxID=48563 RepID=UPI001B87032B